MLSVGGSSSAPFLENVIDRDLCFKTWVGSRKKQYQTLASIMKPNGVFSDPIAQRYQSSSRQKKCKTSRHGYA